MIPLLLVSLSLTSTLAGRLPQYGSSVQSSSVNSPITSIGGGNSPFYQLFSGNIIEQTRAQAESTKTVLKSLANNKKAAQYIQRVLDSSACLNKLDDTLETIEEAANLVEKNGPEILNIVNIFDLLEDEKNITVLISSSAHIIRIMEDLIPNLTQRPSKVCNASPAERIEAFKDLAKLLEDILNDHDMKLLDINRQQIKLSSKIISEVASFLGRLNISIASFDKLCRDGNSYNTLVYDTIGDIMESLAALVDGLGNAKKAKTIRQKGAFVKQIVETFDNLDITSSQECGTYGSFTALAQTLDDLAEIVESVGIEKLSRDLGINLDFVNNDSGVQSSNDRVNSAITSIGGGNPFSQFFSGNIIKQTRAQTESIKTVLKSLERNKKAAPYIQRVIDSSDCIDNLDDAIQTIEEAANLVEKNGPEIQNLINLVNLLENEKDVSKLVRSSAQILRTSEDLIPNLTSRASKVCNASPAQRIEALKGLSKLLEDVFNDHKFKLLDINRQQLQLSSKIISEVASFLGRLNKSLTTIDTLCRGGDNSYNTAVYNTIGDIMESLASLIDNLGGAEKSKDIRKKGEFVKQIVDTFDNLDIKSLQECGTSGSFSGLAQTLEDLADIVESVGVETLSKQLGVNLNFINRF